MERWKSLLAQAKAKITTGIRTRPVAVWLLIATGLGVIAFVLDQPNAEEDQERHRPTHEGDEPLAADTFIPEGFVLVPVEILNYESLDSILGRFGVVDLFAPGPEPGSVSRQVASRVRILRAPRNPNHFAILAPLEESANLVRHGGGLIAVVQNPKALGTRFEKTPLPRRSRAKRERSRIHVETESDTSMTSLESDDE
jgi:hypothetical protein